MIRPILTVIATVGFMLNIEVSASNAARVIVKPDRPHVLKQVSKNVFYSLRINVGEAESVKLNNKARVPAYIIKLDFGKPYFSHLKQTSAQLVDKYAAEELKNRQLVAVTNFPKVNIGIPSFYLVLGIVGISEAEGGTVVLTPSQPIRKGARVVLLNSEESSELQEEDKMSIVEFKDTFEHLDLRVGTVLDAEKQIVDFGVFGHITLLESNYVLSNNKQIIRVFNLSGNDADKDNIIGVIENDQKIPITVERAVPNGRFVL